MSLPEHAQPTARTAPHSMPAPVTEVPVLHPVPDAPAGEQFRRPRRRGRSAPATPPQHPWQAPHLVNVNRGHWLLTAGVEVMVLALAVFAVDTVLLKALVAIQLRVPTAVSWTMALGIAVIMLVPGFRLGAAWREHRATRTPLDPFDVVFGVAWLTLAVILFLIRANAAAPTVSIPGGTLVPTTDTHLVQAWLLLGVQLLTGLSVFTLAARLHNPEASGLRQAMGRQRKVRAELPGAEQAMTRLSHNVQARLTVLEEAAAAADTARRLQHHVGEHVKASARVRLAQLLGNPTDTSTITTS